MHFEGVPMQINIDAHSRESPGHFEAATVLKNDACEASAPAKDKCDARRKCLFQIRKHC